MNHSPVTSVLKADQSGRFEGIAWSFAHTPDSQNDIILPSALASAAKDVPIPLLQEHVGEYVGEIKHAEVSGEGLIVTGQMDPRSDAYKRVKSGEYAGLSIGFLGEAEQSGPLRVFTRAQLLEVSVCRRPVNAGARISAVKAWSELTSEIDLQRFLKSAGMPGRLASKLANAGWPTIERHKDPDPQLLVALRRFANLP